jgi:hypothetical protein
MKTRDQLLTPEVLAILDTYNQGLRTLTETCVLLVEYDVDVQSISEYHFVVQSISDGAAALESWIETGDSQFNLPITFAVDRT